MRRAAGLAALLDAVPEFVWLGLGTAIVIGIIVVAVRLMR